MPPPLEEEPLEELPPEEELLEELPEEELPPELEPLLELELPPELLPLDELLEVHLPPELEPLEAPELELLECEEQSSGGVVSSLQPYMNVPPTAMLARRASVGRKIRPAVHTPMRASDDDDFM